MELKLSWRLLCATLLAAGAAAQLTYTASETEMFALPISPNMFNWTYQEFERQYRFHAALRGAAELPAWLRYVYSGRHHAGFLFGTPPRGTRSPITLEVIGLNRQDFETRRLLLNLVVSPKDPAALARHEIQLKIDNLNVEDLLDQYRMKDLKEIFSRELWKETEGDLYPTFLASAIDLGARLPLKPNEGEGLVVRLGSPKPFSGELRRLRDEVRPLSRLASCPRDYKRTTVERLFRTTAFALDWCSFKLFDTTYTAASTELTEILDDTTTTGNRSPDVRERARLPEAAWSAPRLDELPTRSYAREFTLAVVVPVLLMVLSVAVLTAVLCFHHVGVPDEETEHFFDNIFQLCEEYQNKRAQKTGVELCRYGTGDTEQTRLGDSASNKSPGVSPNNSLMRPYSPKSTTNLAANYNRPQPPPYLGSGTNTLHHRRPGQNENTPSTCSHSPDNRTTLALEESLQLLNEANIASADYIDKMNLRNERIIPILKEPIVDMDDGSEDYVPVKLDGAGYVQMKADLAGYVPMKDGFGMNGAFGKSAGI